jgi:hypothetical protein
MPLGPRAAGIFSKRYAPKLAVERHPHELSRFLPNTPQVYQFYFHKDRGLNRAMLQRAKDRAP